MYYHLRESFRINMAADRINNDSDNATNNHERGHMHHNYH